MRYHNVKRFELGPHHIKVKTVKTCTGCDENVDGLAVLNKNLIEIKQSEYSPEYKEFLIFHEAFHHILSYTGYPELDSDEIFVDRVSAAWLQVIKTME